MAPIHDACVSGDVEEVKRLLNASSDQKGLLETVDENGNNPYVLALIHKHYDIMRIISIGKTWLELFVLYVNVSKHYTLNCTLHEIIENGYQEDFSEEYILENIQKLLKEGINIHARDGNLSSPLHIACYYKFSKIVKVLLDHGADVNAINRNLEQPIHLMCDIRDEDTPEVFTDILLLLLSHGANLNTLNIHNKTPCDIMFQDNIGFDNYKKAFTDVMIDKVINLKESLEFTKKENNITPQVQELFIHASIAMRHMENMRNA
jgi:Ankyrin repeats (many copies)